MKRISLHALFLAVFAAACLTTAATAESTISTAASLDLAAGSIVITQEGDVTVFTQGDTVIRTTAGSGIIRQTNNGTATTNTISLESGTVTLTISDLNVSSLTSPISLAKNTHLKLILLSNNSLFVSYDQDCIDVPTSAELTIQGPGAITAIADADGSGIGSHVGSCGTINILSGTVTAEVDRSQYGGSGIGGNDAIISISGGTVTAIGGESGAGIKGDSIIISDGTIIAEGGYKSEYCVGIRGSSITIDGGSIEATGSKYASGISGATIVINGGETTATGDLWGAGIGGTNCTIIISGGTITATGGTQGAGIGGREGFDGGTITISGGTVTATSRSAAGIGGGYKDHGGTITISGGTIVATSSSGAGIGGGYDGYGGGSVMGGTVSISHADVTASGDYCAIGHCESIIIDKSAVVNLSFSNSRGSACQEKVKIEAHPMASTALTGNRANFTVAAYGYSGLSYQWQTWDEELQSWVELEGQTSPLGMSLRLSAETNGSKYRCKLTNGWGNVVYTDSARAYVLAFTQQPTDTGAELNGIATLSVIASCENVTYQWQRSYNDGATWTNVVGETYRTLMVSTTLSENNALYRCVITAANGDSLASDAARITVESDAITYTTEYYLQDSDGKGYTLADRVVTEGTAGSTAAAPEKTFEHFTENTALSTLNGTVLADNSLTLARYYDRNSYTVSFNMTGGAAEAPITARYEAEVTAPPNPIRAGYTFAGWYADEALTEEYEFSTMPGENITVYAKWALLGEGRGTEYKITGISLLDGNYTPLSGIPADRFYVEVSVRNLSSSTMDTLILSTYDADGRFLGMQFLRSNPPVGYTFVLGTTLDNRSGEIAKIKAFMLPVLGGVVPLAESVEYTG